LISIAVITICFAAAPRGAGQDKGESIPKLNKTEREALVSAAQKAYQKHVKSDRRDGNLIRKDYWGEAIERLNPQRVYSDGANVAIVLHDDGKSEGGIYVSLAISSYIPMVGERFLVLEALSEPGDKAAGSLYRYKAKKR